MNNRNVASRASAFLTFLTISAMPMLALAATGEEAFTTSEISIPAGDLEAALKALARQTGVQLLYDIKAVQGVQTRGVESAKSAQDAIARLLEGTSLKTSTDTSGAILIGVPETRTLSLVEGSAGQSETRLAQAEAGADSLETLEEVVVTGTHIRGAQESPSPMITITREEIEKTGVATVQDLFEDLPQNFAEISTDGLVGATGGIAGINQERASGVSLRGLGPGSTLTLLNGRRRPGALDGHVVDISTIPLSMIERVEIVTGGRSAVYGSDAVAGVVNLVTRRDFRGAESQISYGDSVHPGGDRFQLSQIYGQARDRGGFVAAYDYATEQELDFVGTGLLPPGTGLTEYTIFPHTRHHSGFLSGHFDLNDRIELYADALYTTKDTESSNSFADPTFSSEVANEFSSDQYSFDAGARLGLSPSWQMDISANRGVVDTETVSAVAFSVPGFDFSSVSHNAVRTELTSASAVADGPLFSIASRQVRTALGVEYRSESLDQTISAAPAPNPERRRNVRSAFAEMLVLIVPSVELSLAGRYDDYSDFGGTFNPQFGLVWTAVPGLRIRGSYSEAFRAPDLADVYALRDGQMALFTDTAAPGGLSPVLMASGGRQIDAEEAQTWSVGFDFEPEWAPGARLSLSYFDVDYKGRIGTIDVFFSTFSTLLQEADAGLYPGTVIRNPSAEQLDAILAALDFPVSDSFSFPISTPFDPEGAGQDFLDTFPNLVLFDNRIANIAIESVNGIDMTFDTEYDAAIGKLAFGVNGTYTLDHDRAVTARSPLFSLLNAPGRPVDLRARANAGWTRGAYGAYLYINYTDSYPDHVFAPFRPVASWTTADLTLRFDGRASEARGMLNGLTATLSIENLLDKDPPEAAGTPFGFNYDPANANPIGRLISLRLAKRW
jgi:iron complex outermembrane recepter protein